MSETNKETPLQHRVFTWIGVAAFLGGTVVYPSVKLFTGNDMNPWLIGAIIVASVAAVGSERVVSALSELIRAWRSGE